MIDEEKWREWWEKQPDLYRARDVIASPDVSSGTKQSPAKGGQAWRSPRREAPRDDVKKYILVEFPYPSGSGLHIGHAFTQTGADVYARFKRMQGYNVLFPMGYDAFGLPTENYAIKVKRPPQEVTQENIAKFRTQMKKLAMSFDWSREVDTTDPAYYKWTQWIFIQLFKKGLACKKEMPINWCPSCKIGLANEEVLQSRTGVSVCERCGAEVSRRNIAQWVVKITDYADKLLEGLEKTDFVEKVKMAQINWIGKSEGARIKFKLSSDDCARKIGLSPDLYELEVFTTRPDTIFGATFMVVAPEHILVNEILTRDEIFSCSRASHDCARKNSSLRQNIDQIRDYVVNARKKSDLQRTELNKEKTGVFSGIYAVNPATGKEIPIWISDFVLESYGTGAIMAVPAHDERDFVFAKKFGLPIIQVINVSGSATILSCSRPSEGTSDDCARKIRPSPEFYGSEIDKGIMVNSGFLNGMEPKEAMKKMIEWLKEKGVGEGASSYHLRDWIFSRQHYWGEPIPMIFCPNCAKQGISWFSQNPQSLDLARDSSLQKGALKNSPFEGEKHEVQKGFNAGWFPVPEKDLPIRLPEIEHYEPTDTGESPLAKMTEWVKTKCSKCGGEAKRETDTMPNWAGSDWYFLRYIDPKNDQSLAEMEKMRYWLPVDVYVGGDEHNTLHLLYSRFIVNFLYDIGVVPVAEPYFKRMSHGVILGPDGQRMSKSRGNVIVPDEMAEKWGVDVIRMYLMFMGPFEATMAWNERTLNGVKRFLDKFYKFINFSAKGRSAFGRQFIIYKQSANKTASGEIVESDSRREVKVIINKLVDGVTKDMEGFRFNTAIAKMMETLNQLRIKNYKLRIEDIETLIKLIAPLAPYMAEELWHQIAGNADLRSVHISEWPKVEEKYLIEDEVVIPVAVNGKVRDQLKIKNYPPRRTGELRSKEEILEMAKKTEKIQKWIEGKKIVKEIYVVNKMVNFVVR